jgi:hypothetical protein
LLPPAAFVSRVSPSPGGFSTSWCESPVNCTSGEAPRARSAPGSGQRLRREGSALGHAASRVRSKQVRRRPGRPAGCSFVSTLSRRTQCPAGCPLEHAALLTAWYLHCASTTPPRATVPLCRHLARRPLRRLHARPATHLPPLLSPAGPAAPCGNSVRSHSPREFIGRHRTTTLMLPESAMML